MSKKQQKEQPIEEEEISGEELLEDEEQRSSDGDDSGSDLKDFIDDSEQPESKVQPFKKVVYYYKPLGRGAGAPVKKTEPKRIPLRDITPKKKFN
jgi:hypothetical protein